MSAFVLAMAICLLAQAAPPPSAGGGGQCSKVQFDSANCTGPARDCGFSIAAMTTQNAYWINADPAPVSAHSVLSGRALHNLQKHAPG